jgi:CO dehydrogenase/acetyl-CoA synthase gamma subunit (corrinoid Fe-S protein)
MGKQNSKEDIDSLKTQCRDLQDEGIRNIILNMQQVENAPSIVLGTIRDTIMIAIADFITSIATTSK